MKCPFVDSRQGVEGFMNRREFLKRSSVFCTLSALGTADVRSQGISDAGDSRTPNILWISCEDTSCDLGCYGDPYADTPNLDRLAREGCRYTSVFAPYPVCAPTRSSIITAMYPGTIGTMHMRTGDKGYEAVPPPYVKCFTEYLRANGYYCTNRSKTDYQFSAPFTAWDPGRDWRSRPANMPFFCVINLNATHESQNWPKQNERLVHDPRRAPVPPYYPDTPLVRQNIARCYDNITRMDRQVGEILQMLAEDGLADQTAVFFWSDHGRGLPRCKRWCYDSGIHVPLIVRWPGRIQSNTVCDDLVSLCDLGPTVLSLTRIDVPAHMQGRPFLGPLKAAARSFIIAGRERMDLGSDDYVRAIRDKRYKYIRNFMPEKPYSQPIPYEDRMPIMQEWRRLYEEGALQGTQELYFRPAKPAEEFYDTLKDPHEVDNLIGVAEQQERIASMRTDLQEWMKQSGDLGGTPEGELIERMWPGRKQPVTAAPSIDVEPGEKGLSAVLPCATEGASIGYRLSNGGPWLLYSKPIQLRNRDVLQCKAIRLGYKESPITTQEIHS